MEKVKIYTAASALHDSAAVENAHKELIAVLDDTLSTEYVPVGEYAGEPKVDLLVATGGVEEMVREAFAGRMPSKVTLLADGLQNSLAASLEIAAWLRANGCESRIIHDRPEAMVKRFATERGMLDGARVGIIHEPSGWLIASDVDYEAVGSRFGIEFVHVALGEVEQAYASVSEGADVCGVRRAPRREPSEKDIEDALRLAEAVRQVVVRHRLDAFTLKCFDLLDSLKTTGCLALSLLSREGVPGGCEGDVPALLTMLLAQRLAGEDAFMANPSRIDVGNNQIILAHCTLPYGMGKDNIMRSHFESGMGVAVQSQLPVGPATVIKWWGKDMGKAFVSDATILENLDNPSMCRTQIKLALDSPVDYFLQRPLGNHHVVVIGHHADTFRKFFKANGIEIVD